MLKPSLDIAQMVRSHMDSERSFPLREVRDRLLPRWPILLVCVVVMPLIAAALTSLVPPAFKTSAQILIRHESRTLGSLASSGRETSDASGPVSAALIRTTPVLARMVEAVDVRDTDLARPAYKVLFGHLLRLISPLLPKDPPAGPADPALARQFLGAEFKSSIAVTKLQTEPQPFGRQDELIEVTLTAANPVKVAAMTNALCEAFIKEHNLRSEAEAVRTLEILAETQRKTREAFEHLLAKPPAADRELLGERSARSESTTSGLARHIADLELALIEARRDYGENSQELQKARQILEQTRTVHERERTLEEFRGVLAALTEKQREATLKLDLVRKNNSGLSIVEPALPARVTSMAKLLRYAVPVGVSLFLGTFLGLGLMVAANAVDGTVRSRWEVERITGAPIAGILPSAKRSRNKGATTLPSALGYKLLEFLDHVPGKAQVAAIVSPGGQEDVSALAMKLCELLAADARRRVLLVDGNLPARNLTRLHGHDETRGLADLLLEASPKPADAIVRNLGRFAFLPAGKPAAASQLALIKQPWHDILAELRSQADYIIIDAGGLELGQLTRPILRAADSCLLAAVVGETQLSALEAAVRELDPSSGRLLATTLLAP